MAIIKINDARELSIAIQGLETTDEFDEPIPRNDEITFCVNNRYVDIRYRRVEDGEMYWAVDYAGRTRDMPTRQVGSLCARLLKAS